MLSINPIKTNKFQQPECHCKCGCCHQNFNDNNETDSFVRKSGILPPKNWKPDPYAGLGPEIKLTPQEKLKKKWEDFKKPKYVNSQQVEEQPQEQIEVPQKKSFKQKVKDFFKKLFHRN